MSLVIASRLGRERSSMICKDVWVNVVPGLAGVLISLSFPRFSISHFEQFSCEKISEPGRNQDVARDSGEHSKKRGIPQ